VRVVGHDRRLTVPAAPSMERSDRWFAVTRWGSSAGTNTDQRSSGSSDCDSCELCAARGQHNRTGKTDSPSETEPRRDQRTLVPRVRSNR
jgi:hypothetical protein